MPPNPSLQLCRETLSLHESAEFPTSVKGVGSFALLVMSLQLNSLN
jgi:hypothetical protein